MNRIKFVSLSWTLIFTLSLFAGACRLVPEYPEVYPEEWKQTEFWEKEAKILRPGVNYYHYHFKTFPVTGKPLSIYLLEIKWKEAGLAFHCAVCGDALRTVPDMVRGKNAVAAVNGAYFHYVPPKPYFDIKCDGVLFEAANPKNHYSQGLCMNGSDFPVILKMNQENMAKYENVIQGYWLGHEWKNSISKLDSHDGTPYTVIGLDPEHDRVVIWVNDGRFPKESFGISFKQIADVLFALGCPEVLSIDGGGSTTMVLPDENGVLQVMNHPSDNKIFDHNAPRKVQNCLYLSAAGKSDEQ